MGSIKVNLPLLANPINLKKMKSPTLKVQPAQSPLHSLPQSPFLNAWAIGVLAWIFFLIYIQFPKGLNFDEFHYIPSARQWLSGLQNQNAEHPPLGKLLIALGMALGGDMPFGWRWMSALFGGLTLSGTYLFALSLFRNQKVALWVVLLTLFNHLLYVQARIAMLDTFMYAGIVWGGAAFVESLRDDEDRRYSTSKLWAFSGAFFGLATACKWFALIPWMMCIFLILGVLVFKNWGVELKASLVPTQDSSTYFKESNWYSKQLFSDLKGQTGWAVVLCWVLIPVAAYLLSFIPNYILQKPPMSLMDLIWVQKKMYDLQLRVVNSHPYMSTFKDWPLLFRPIWYAFDKEPGGVVRGVLLLGNPWIMVLGVWALLDNLWAWFRDRSRIAFLILSFYAAFTLCWIVIPRKVSFYYYYYPAGMILSFALAYTFFRNSDWGMGLINRRYPAIKWIFLAVAFGFFVYFFPILSAMKITDEEYRKWMWFRSWI